MSQNFTEASVPSLAGKTIVVTGGNSGIGLEAAVVFAAKGARTVLACRDPGRAAAAVDEVKRRAGGGEVRAMRLDLADLASVRSFADALRSEESRLDVLVNNAGVMALPRMLTKDGFEMQLGTNHLGHFALTGHLLPLLRQTPSARIVSVSSVMHRIGRIDFDDLQHAKSYFRWTVYGQSKIANLYFTYELSRRLARAGDGTLAVACHPGYSDTNLVAGQAAAVGATGLARFMKWVNGFFAQSASMGALPTIYAAAEPSIRNGEYVGPGGFLEMGGYPKIVQSNRLARDEDVARRLWDVSEQLTSVRFSL